MYSRDLGRSVTTTSCATCRGNCMEPAGEICGNSSIVSGSSELTGIVLCGRATIVRSIKKVGLNRSAVRNKTTSGDYELSHAQESLLDPMLGIASRDWPLERCLQQSSSSA